MKVLRRALTDDLGEFRLFRLNFGEYVVGATYGARALVGAPGGMLVAIDPEPSAGDPHFDPALWALTHRPGKGVRERCALLAGLLELDRTRLWEWCLVLAVPEVALERESRARAHHEFLVEASSDRTDSC